MHTSKGIGIANALIAAMHDDLRLFRRILFAYMIRSLTMPARQSKRQVQVGAGL